MIRPLLLGTTAALLLATAACDDGKNGKNDDGGAPLDGSVNDDLATPPDFAGPQTRKLDVLFMIDNSATMQAASDQLVQHFGDFLQLFDQLTTQNIFVDLHIGVVTSDYGAGQLAMSGCSPSPGGDNGFLQTIGKAADPSCVAPVGGRYISYAYNPAGGEPKHNLPMGQTIAKTFTCMASVGATGCGFEHQLESVYAALHNTVENAGFLREDALLAVVFLTNEDDGSAAPDTIIYDPTKTAELGAFDTYRQAHYGILCGSPPMPPPYGASGGALSNCVPAPNPDGATNRAYDVRRYLDFFSLPKPAGGVKNDPRDVALIAIDGPEAPVETILAQTNTGNGVPPDPAYVSCGPDITSICTVREQHTCQNHLSPQFFADPAVRLNTVVRAANYHQISSICGDNLDAAPDFSKAMSEAGRMVRERLYHQ